MQSFSQRNEEYKLHIRLPSPGFLHQEDRPQEHYHKDTGAGNCSFSILPLACYLWDPALPPHQSVCTSTGTPHTNTGPSQHNSRPIPAPGPPASRPSVGQHQLQDTLDSSASHPGTKLLTSRTAQALGHPRASCVRNRPHPLADQH